MAQEFASLHEELLASKNTSESIIYSEAGGWN
jgi:hypothetical protein